MNAWITGLIAICIFAGSLPATKIAIMGFSAEFLTGARASIAGILALLMLCYYRQPLPNRQQLRGLGMIAIGVVFGFPFFTALALQYITSSYSTIFVALLPLSTAVFAVILGERLPKWPFWIFAILGSCSVVIYMFLRSSGELQWQGSLLMIIAILLCGLGYAEGGRLSRQLGGWQVISWALILALPVMLFLSYAYYPSDLDQVGLSAWLGMVYVSVFSMFIGFIFWYHGLAKGGVLKIGQLQLLQPFFGLILSALLLGESIDMMMFAVCSLVVLCVWSAKKYN
ncbi:DMT family transporter [Acinetobacter larvae]|uniref:DMT family transporter n=1 Tax=Acinetobacter larvae TaxID=1789224 RepID=UPI000AD7DFE2